MANTATKKSHSTLMERNRQIGHLLSEVRKERGISVSRCAAAIHTNRRRYMQLESGEALIGLAEVEVLVRFLGIPAQRLWELVNGGSAEAQSSGDGIADGGVSRTEASDLLLAQVSPGQPFNMKFVPSEGGGGAIYLAREEAQTASAARLMQPAS